jgi:hypothetical protein
MLVGLLECSWEDMPYGFQGCLYYGEYSNDIATAGVVLVPLVAFPVALWSLLLLERRIRHSGKESVLPSDDA